MSVFVELVCFLDAVDVQKYCAFQCFRKGRFSVSVAPFFTWLSKKQQKRMCFCYFCRFYIYWPPMKSNQNLACGLTEETNDNSHGL